MDRTDAPTESATQPALRLQLLGALRLHDTAGNELPLPYEKVGLLLALLALHSSPWPREALAEMLWPDVDLAQGRANLRRALFDLRACLSRALSTAQADAMLVADKRQLQLRDHPALQIDSQAFALAQLDATSTHAPAQDAALQRACQLYGGTLLEGLRLDEHHGLESWLAPRREALQRQALQCLDSLADLRLRQGDVTTALQLSERALQLDPWREESLRRCMALLGRDRPDQALQRYEQFSQQLSRALQLSPQATTQSLAQSLREQQNSAAVRPHAQAERRRVVALACEWDAEGDPEDTLPLLLPVLAQARQQLQAHGAWIQQAEGAELLAFFGHPQADEQSPRRALDAALAVRQLASQQAPAPRSLCVRLGLHVGWVHSLPGVNSPDSMGTLSREARRLAWQAQPGEVLVSADLRQQGAKHHRFDRITATGEACLIAARDEARTTRLQGLQAMVGREPELQALIDSWREGQAQPRAVWVQGEPGMGKTRLLQALRASLTQGPAAVPADAVIQLHCQAAYSHSPWHPLVRAVQSWLQSATSPSSPTDDPLALLAQMSGMPANALAPLAGLIAPPMAQDSPRPNHREVDNCWLGLLQAISRERPMLMMVEDLHWADPSTLELLGRLLQAQLAPPGLLVLSSRQPPPPAWLPSLPMVRVLQPLPPEHMAALIAQLDYAPRSSTERRQVLERAQGVPLFAQELARSLIAAPQERVPATLWDLLAARLDRLPAPLKRLLQCASVLGEDWDETWLASLQTELQEAAECPARLRALAADGLLLTAGPARWRFRHALIRDAAYESLGRQERRTLHRRAADALLHSFARHVADAPEILAYHLHETQDAAAAHYWLQAGRRAAQQSAHAEARHFLEQGLHALARFAKPRGEQEQHDRHHRLSLPLQLGLGNSLLALEGYGSHAARACFAQSLAACPAQDAGHRMPALWGLWLGSRSTADEGPALLLARQLLDEAQRARDPVAEVQAHYALGNNQFFAGQLQAAAQSLAQASTQAQALPAEPFIARFAEHGGMGAQAMRCWPLALLGEHQAAHQAATQALQQARALGHAQTLCFSLTMVAVMHRHLREPDAAQALSLELLALAERHDLALWRAVGALVMGWVMAYQGDEAGLVPIRQAVAASAVAMPSTEATFRSFLIEALLALGQAEEALDWIASTLPMAQERQETYLLPELWRMRTEALNQLGRWPAWAGESLARARHLAQAMGAELWLARCQAMLTR